MPWPRNIPSDLRKRLDAVLGLRSCTAPEVWEEVRGWLITREATPPDGVDREPKREDDWDVMDQ